MSTHKTKLLRENRERACREANAALKAAQDLVGVFGCTCAPAGAQVTCHAKNCAQQRARAIVYAVYDASHRAGQCRERERVARALRSLIPSDDVEKLSTWGCGVLRALQRVREMRWPK